MRGIALNARSSSGFTMIELVITVSITAILLGMGIPSFTEAMRSNQLTAQANNLVTALNVARSEATKRGIAVAVCSSSDQASCSASTTWNSGWIVFTDDIGTAGVVNVGDQVLQTWPAISAGLQVTSPSGAAFVRYSQNGASDAIATFNLLRPSCTGMKARQIGVSSTGRISSQKMACP